MSYELKESGSLGFELRGLLRMGYKIELGDSTGEVEEN
jgi:hypothetical protein